MGWDQHCECFGNRIVQTTGRHCMFRESAAKSGFAWLEPERTRITRPAVHSELFHHTGIRRLCIASSHYYDDVPLISANAVTKKDLAKRYNPCSVASSFLRIQRTFYTRSRTQLGAFDGARGVGLRRVYMWKMIG
jgi:hypothetical protein